MTRLDQDPAVVDLARQLGIPTRGKVLELIRDHALSFVDDCVASFPAVRSLDELRSLLCDRLSICLRIVQDDADLRNVADEFGFSDVESRHLVHEFDHEHVEGWLVRNPRSGRGLRRWIAIVDGRASRASRANFTAWHEITHAIVTPHQLELGLRRSIPVDRAKDPVESVVDMVSGHLAFYAPIVGPVLNEEIASRGGMITLDAIEGMRLRVAPEASFQSAAIAAARLSDQPLLFVQVEPRYKRSEVRALRSGQGSLQLAGAERQVVPKLRLSMAVPAEGPGSGLAIFKPMRVPHQSVLTQAWESPVDVSLQADEDQAWWETSTNGPLPPRPVRVEAVRRGAYVYGIIAPR